MVSQANALSQSYLDQLAVVNQYKVDGNGDVEPNIPNPIDYESKYWVLDSNPPYGEDTNISQTLMQNEKLKVTFSFLNEMDIKTVFV